MSIYNELNLMDVDIENAPDTGGSYKSVVTRGNIAFVSIQFPIEKNQFMHCGKLGGEISTVDGCKAAELCALNVLRQIKKHVGFKNIVGLNHMDVYYRATENWDEAPLVADGASDFFNKVLGPAGIHSRSISGVNHLPRNFCIGITTSFTLGESNIQSNK